MTQETFLAYVGERNVTKSAISKVVESSFEEMIDRYAYQRFGVGADSRDGAVFTLGVQIDRGHAHPAYLPGDADAGQPRNDAVRPPLA